MTRKILIELLIEYDSMLAIEWFMLEHKRILAKGETIYLEDYRSIPLDFDALGKIIKYKIHDFQAEGRITKAEINKLVDNMPNWKIRAHSNLKRKK